MEITALELVLIILSTVMLTAVATFIVTCLLILKIGKRLSMIPDGSSSFPTREQ